MLEACNAVLKSVKSVVGLYCMHKHQSDEDLVNIFT